MVSFYWTITTITTVGYGDITAQNFPERVFCSIMMVLGVISFSLTTGSLTSIIYSSDNKKMIYVEKMEKLNLIQRRYNLPPDIYNQMKQSIGYQIEKSNNDIDDFLDQLPHKL